MSSSEILAVGATELSLVLLLLIVVVVPIAAVAFARSGKAYSEIGKGRYAVDFGEEANPAQEEEIRQLVEAKAYRQARRGETPVDVEREITRLLRGEPKANDPDETEIDPETAQIREEMRQVAVARNESRERRGEKPLDVEAEIERMMNEYM